MAPTALTGILLLVVSVAIAQVKEGPCVASPYEAGLSVGRNQYFGDLHTSRVYLSTGFNYTLHGYIRRQFSPYVTLRGNIYAGGLAARDGDNPQGRWDYRRVKFSSPFVELSAMAEFYPLRTQAYQTTGATKTRLSPYGFIGIGSVYTKPLVTVESSAPFPPYNDLLAQDAAQKTAMAPVIPVGIGLSYNAGSKLKLGLDVGYRFTPSDYLDGFKIASHGYSQNNDSYVMANVLVGFQLGGADRDGDGTPDKCDVCPKLAGPVTLMGCPDADGDGVIDFEDSCPDEFGDPATCGCPDDDKDGIPNACDCCPYEKGERAYHGCTREHQIENEHVRQPNQMRYCPHCPTDLPSASRQKPTDHRKRTAPIRLTTR